MASAIADVAPRKPHSHLTYPPAQAAGSFKARFQGRICYLPFLSFSVPHSLCSQGGVEMAPFTRRPRF